MGGDSLERDWQDIIEFGFEGGNLKLLGNQIEDGTWLFKGESSEWATVNMLQDEDLTDFAVRKSDYGTRDLEKALFLDSHLWMKLRPLDINKDFRQLIWSKLIEPNEKEVRNLYNWEILCSPDDF